MPSMFSEADLDTFQRLRCAFDPHGLANPGQGDADPAPVRRGPRALSRAPARARRRRRAVLDARRDAAPRDVRGGRGGSRGGRGRAASRSGSAAPAPRSAGAAPAAEPDVELHTTGLDRDHRAQRRRPDRGPPGRACRSPRRRSTFARRGQMLSLDPPLGRGDAARRTIGGVDRDRRLGPAAPPLRGGARPRGRDDGRAQRRDDRPLGRQGDQERRRLRHRQAVLRGVRDARARSWRSASACTPGPAEHGHRARRQPVTRRCSRRGRAAADDGAARARGARRRLAVAARGEVLAQLGRRGGCPAQRRVDSADARGGAGGRGRDLRRRRTCGRASGPDSGPRSGGAGARRRAPARRWPSSCERPARAGGALVGRAALGAELDRGRARGARSAARRSSTRGRRRRCCSTPRRRIATGWIRGAPRKARRWS